MSARDIPVKANRVLLYILLAFFLILIRMWYLSMVEYDTYLQMSKKPQKKTQWEKPLRGTICDRFNLPLAINHIQYDACVCYDSLKMIPTIKRTQDIHGNIIKTYPRKEYIKTLCLKLSSMLNIDPLDVEDVLYGKAALFPTIPFTIQENISESLYYKLKGLERTHPGIYTLKSVKRYYPQKKIGADLIGYVGAINEHEYLKTAHEIQSLEQYLDDHERSPLVFLPKGFSSTQAIKNRLSVLKNQRYQLNDYLGKTGIEAKFENSLRGTYGKNHFEINTKGSIIRELPGSKKPLSGEKLVLNISSELQEFAEALLAENEEIRDKRFPSAGKNHHLITPPWIKGGSIVAMLPQTGEIVAMASYPRMDNNDFIQNDSNNDVAHWLENKNYLANLWDGKKPLEREFYSFIHNNFYKEEKKLSLEIYLDRLLSLHSQAKKAMHQLSYLETAINFQKNLLTLLDVSEQPHMYALIDSLYPASTGHRPSSFSTSDSQILAVHNALNQHDSLLKELKTFLDKILGNVIHNDDKLLVLDLTRLIAPSHLFDESLLKELPQELLSTYRKFTQAFAILHDNLYDCTKNAFHLHDFRKWREQHFKNYLAEKRKEEKENHHCPKPYIDYLASLEKNHFQQFWKDNKWLLIQLMLGINSKEILNAHPNLSPYLETFKKNHEQNKNSSIKIAFETLQNRLKKLPLHLELPYLTTMRRYQDLSEKLFGFYPQIKKRKGTQTEKDLAGAFYPANGYGYGRSFAFRQATPLGSIFKIITAYEAIRQSCENPSFANQKDLNPLTIIDEIQPTTNTTQGLVLGFHEDGSKITRRYKGGILPRSHASLGKVDFLKAFERSSNVYFSLLASDVIQDPNDLTLASLKFGFGNKTGIDLPGEIPGALPKDLEENRSGLYAFAIGQHSLIVTPLQTAVMLSSLVNGGEVLKPQIIQSMTCTKDQNTIPFTATDYIYKDYLNRVGIFFPFFIQNHEKPKDHDIQFFEKTFHRQLFLPPNIKDYLLQGLHNVVSSPRGAARAELIRYLYSHTQAMKNYLNLKYQLAGKTSSAEVAYHPTLDRECPSILCKDIWFGGISFEPHPENSPMSKNHEDIPELVVVVYLKFGDFGKEAAPLAGEIVNKWRSITKKAINYKNCSK